MTTNRSNLKRVAFAAASAAAVATFGFAAPALAEEEMSSAELLKKIEELQKQVESLQSNQEATTRQLTAAEIDAAVARVLDDAEARSDMLSMQGFTAGHNGKEFVLQNEDGTFKLVPNFQFQLRWVSNILEDAGGGSDFESDEGFEIRRMKFGVKGNAFSKDLKYDFKWATNDDGGALILEDAKIAWAFADNWTFFAGQFKDPVHFEEITSSSRQMAVDRSLINELIGGGLTDRVQGAGFTYEQDKLKATFLYHDGINTDNTEFAREAGDGITPSISPDPPQFGGAARVEYLVFGDSAVKKDFATIAGNGVDEASLAVGVGADFTDFGDEEALIHTADVIYKSGEGQGSYSLFAAYYGVYTETGMDTGYTYGFEGLAAYAVTEKMDVFARGSFTDPDDDGFLGDDDFFEATVGGNYYFANHSAKVTVDVTYLFDGTPDSASGIGVRSGDDDDQIIVRGQFQLLI
ncbi:MAG: porin [Planctomycetota bacterium]